MLEEKTKEIRKFCIKNSKQSNIDKYSRYFKEGFNGYGIDREVFETQRNSWIEEWKNEMTIDSYLDLGDKLVQIGKYEEISLAIHFIDSQRKNYTKVTFDRIGNWFDLGISNWANTDVLCGLVISSFFVDGVVELDSLKQWTSSQSEWKRRAVPVSLIELIKRDLKPKDAISLIEPLMLDHSMYVQKGIGTLLRGLWKIYPEEIEAFLLKWKDQCGRLIIQYSTEKMDKEYRMRFRKAK